MRFARMRRPAASYSYSVVSPDATQAGSENSPSRLRFDFRHSSAVEASQLGDIEALRGAYRIEVPDTAAATSLILAHPEIFTDYEITKGRMDDVFLAATGKKVGEDAL